MHNYYIRYYYLRLSVSLCRIIPLLFAVTIIKNVFLFHSVCFRLKDLVLHVIKFDKNMYGNNLVLEANLNI